MQIAFIDLTSTEPTHSGTANKQWRRSTVSEEDNTNFNFQYMFHKGRGEEAKSLWVLTQQILLELRNINSSFLTTS